MASLAFPLKHRKSILICATPRSRSTLFSDALALTGQMGNPAEWFNDYLIAETQQMYGLHWESDPSLRLLAVIDRAVDAEGVFSVKAIDQYFFRLCDALRAASGAEDSVSDWDLVAPFFPDPRFVFWRRSSRLRQAISHAKAHGGGAWHSNQKATIRPSEHMLYDGFYIDWLIAEVEAGEARWMQFFAEGGVPYLELQDEELLADYAGTVWRVAEYLGIETDRLVIDPDANPRSPVGDGINEFWETLHLEGKQHGFPADYQDTSDHWSNLTHRLWINVDTSPCRVVPGEPFYLQGSVENQLDTVFELRNSKGIAPFAAVRGQWVSKVNSLRRMSAFDAPIPVRWEPKQRFAIELVLDHPELAEHYDLFLLLIVRDESWVRMNGINSPQISFELPS